MSWVRPGVLLTNARRRRPASVLMALDLPALERPANAISGAPAGGSSRGSWTERVYVARASGNDEACAGGVALFPRRTVKSRSFSRGFRMRAVTRFAGFMTLVYAGVSAAAAPAAAKPDLARGQQLATTVCAACHGATGISAAPANPHLAGQGADYIASQLAAFKSKARPSPIMEGMAAGLSPEDMIAVGAYYQSQKPVEGLARDKAL